jgi:hypothetical protein
MNNTTWSSYRRAGKIHEKSTENQELNELITVHHSFLWKTLVKDYKDEDVFNDTYLKLTSTYDENIDFIEQFTATFKQIRLAYRRDDFTANNKLVIHTDFAEHIGGTLIDETDEIEPINSLIEVDLDSMLNLKIAA